MTPILLAFVAVEIAVILGNGRPGGIPQPVRVVMLTPVKRARNGNEHLTKSMWQRSIIPL